MIERADEYGVNSVVQKLTLPMIVSFDSQTNADCYRDIIQLLAYCWCIIILFLTISHGYEMIEPTDFVPEFNAVLQALMFSLFRVAVSVSWCLIGFAYALLTTHSSFILVQTTAFSNVYLDVQIASSVLLITRPLAVIFDQSYSFKVQDFFWTLSNSVMCTFINIDMIQVQNWNVSSHIICVLLQICCLHSKFTINRTNYCHYVLIFLIILRILLTGLFLNLTKFTMPYTFEFVMDFFIGSLFLHSRDVLYSCCRQWHVNRLIVISLLTVFTVALLNMGLAVRQPHVLSSVLKCKHTYSFSFCQYSFLLEFPYGICIACSVLLSTTTRIYRPNRENLDSFAQTVAHETESCDISIERFFNLCTALLFCTPICYFNNTWLRIMFDADFVVVYYINTMLITPCMLVGITRLLARYREDILSEIVACCLKLSHKTGFSDPPSFFAALRPTNTHAEEPNLSDPELENLDTTTSTRQACQ